MKNSLNFITDLNKQALNLARMHSLYIFLINQILSIIVPILRIHQILLILMNIIKINYQKCIVNLIEFLVSLNCQNQKDLQFHGFILLSLLFMFNISIFSWFYMSFSFIYWLICLLFPAYLPLNSESVSLRLIN